MNNRQRSKAVLNYEKYDRLPLVHFGYWQETLEKWVSEGHLTNEDIIDVWDASPAEKKISTKLGFDFNYYTTYQDKAGFSSLFPKFESRVLKKLENGMTQIIDSDGAIVLIKEGLRSIPSEIGHTLVDRRSWEEHYLPRLQFTSERFDENELAKLAETSKNRTEPLGIFCKSLFGQIRNWMGVEGISYLYADDEALYDEIIAVNALLCYKSVERILKSGIEFDFGHFWEDICFKNGPLVSPAVFYQKVGPHYQKITTLLNDYGIDIVSLDCDGFIDPLIPAWIDNGVNTMFPIEVGTWGANILPWRQKYGRGLRGVGGMDKNVFARDFNAVDAEIERLKPQIDAGGFIPCPDHRIHPLAKWENIEYYCNKMRRIYG